MKSINIEEADLNNGYFHFTERDRLSSIEKQGLKAQIGDASKMVQDKARVCLSKGAKGILGIKNSFIYEFKQLRICDIPEGYRKYFDIEDFSSTEIVHDNKVYKKIEKRFKDEVYLVVDAHEGEDFLTEETYGFGAEFDIKGKENHDIEASKLSKLETKNGDTAFDVINYIYNRLLEKNPGKEDIIKEMNYDLAEMLEYTKTRERKSISPEKIGRKLINEGVSIKEIDKAGSLMNNIQREKDNMEIGS